MEQMRIVREMRLAEKDRGRESVNIRPRWMCWENVPGAFSSGKPKYEDFRIVLEEIVRICFPNELIPGPYWDIAKRLRHRPLMPATVGLNPTIPAMIRCSRG